MHEITIETPRLILRKSRLSDLDALHTAKEAMWHDLQLWMSWAYDDQASREATLSTIETYGEGTDSIEILLGFEKETGDFVISTGVNHHENANEYSTGYWVAKNKQGKGYATEATNAMIRYIFSALNAKAVHIDYYEGNVHSANVVRKLGFEKRRTDKKAKARCLNGELLDIHRFIMHDTNNLAPLEVTWR